MLNIITKLKNLFFKEKEEVNKEVNFDIDIEQRDNRAKETLNNIAVKLVLYNKVVNQYKSIIPEDFSICPDLLILRGFLDKGFTGRAMQLILKINEVDELETIIKENNTLLEQLSDKLDKDTINKLKSIINKQIDLDKNMKKSLKRIEFLYEKQQTKINEKKTNKT